MDYSSKQLMLSLIDIKTIEYVHMYQEYWMNTDIKRLIINPGMLSMYYIISTYELFYSIILSLNLWLQHASHIKVITFSLFRVNI